MYLTREQLLKVQARRTKDFELPDGAGTLRIAEPSPSLSHRLKGGSADVDQHAETLLDVVVDEKGERLLKTSKEAADFASRLGIATCAQIDELSIGLLPEEFRKRADKAKEPASSEPADPNAMTR